MKAYLLFPLIVLLSCNTVKNPSQAQTEQQYSKTELQLLKDVEVLSSDAYQGRKTGTKGAEMTREYLSNRFKQIGLKPIPLLSGYEQLFSFKNNKGVEIYGKNMLAYIPGKNEQIIVISAHYDHVGVMDNEVYNGADDNASGVAALLQFAEHFKKNKPNYTLVIAAFDAEEMGLRGSRAFVEKPPIPLEKIRMNINMDMISHNDKGELYACGTYKYPDLKKYFITTDPKIKVLLGHDDPKSGHEDWTNQSDQGSFNAKNIPFIYFGVEDHKDYHKASDEYQNINKTFFINAAASIQEIINNIDKERSTQSVIKDKLRMKKQ
ncbi:M20/M25/M40 family metallo-hydrolase [Pedobacter caeni]|uniref:Peptidase family M28 n=1 Tax=Pedobacter caeni TaxID=288992 RepID=A0A1M5AXS9_9SPHI|nr:M20/M25/M40 family metallo-hydrolase [Pedobacter caeni]SHF35084.1 Peptidase family M28 [Pedobacter caeni]